MATVSHLEEGMNQILSSVFDGISIETNCVIQQNQQTASSILMKTGFREPDEIRIIFRERPLRIQIAPLNVHGFGAKISKIENQNAYAQGITLSLSLFL